MAKNSQLISIVVPLYNESANLLSLQAGLQNVYDSLKEYEFETIYVNDGSRDNSLEVLRRLAHGDTMIKIVCLSRNFGKEIAITAGLSEATGDAMITLDADGQFPVELIPEFIRRWQAGAKVVVGLRTANQREGVVKRYGSKLFYSLFNKISTTPMVPASTDFRLIDRDVQQAFLGMTERRRMTRALIDWLGYQPEYIEFVANARTDGETGYSVRRLVKLAVDSMVSSTISPLYIAAYLGMIVLPLSVLLAILMVIDKLANDPLNLNLTGGAFVMVLMLFLIGVLLLSQGIIGLYLSHIHSETQNRPLYVVDQHNSTGLKGDT
jgi:glycosyltransferase involved in cell wall biosynthesis